MKRFAFLYFLFPFVLFAAEVPVLGKQIKSGEVIDKSDLLYININNISKNIITSDKHLIGSVARTNIDANKPVMEHQIKPKALVKKNDLVAIFFVKDNVKLESKGIALENGSDGSMIKVKNLYNSKNLVAKVIGSHAVRID